MSRRKSRILTGIFGARVIHTRIGPLAVRIGRQQFESRAMQA